MQAIDCALVQHAVVSHMIGIGVDVTTNGTDFTSRNGAIKHRCVGPVEGRTNDSLARERGVQSVDCAKVCVVDWPTIKDRLCIAGVRNGLIAGKDNIAIIITSHTGNERAIEKRVFGASVCGFTAVNICSTLRSVLSGGIEDPRNSILHGAHGRIADSRRCQVFSEVAAGIDFANDSNVIIGTRSGGDCVNDFTKGNVAVKYLVDPELLTRSIWVSIEKILVSFFNKSVGERNLFLVLRVQWLCGQAGIWRIFCGKGEGV